MRALTVSVEGHGQARNARQRLVRGIPVLQRIPSIHVPITGVIIPVKVL